MPVLKVEATDEFPIPYDWTDEETASFADEMAVAGGTAELMAHLGAPIEVAPEDFEREKKLLEAVVKKQDKAPLTQINTAYAAAAFLRTYGQTMAVDANQARAAITHKLMEIANCGETKFELKALELLGKHSDIGLFTNKSEITINYKNPEDLENAIKERVKRLLNADIIDVTPLGRDLDEELGIAELPDDDDEDEGEDDEADDAG
jgi:hypothetical protein